MARRLFVESWLRRHPRCQIGSVLAGAGAVEARACREWATDVHEPLKRSRGGSVLDDDNAMSACRPCHDFTEAEPARSTALGLLRPSWSNLTPLIPTEGDDDA